ncbi:MAG TPA: radical SAM protein [Elusimicrobiota bacterium]|nr:radical SAM protein [Elusimicrobiota bacterium]
MKIVLVNPPSLSMRYNRFNAGIPYLTSFLKSKSMFVEVVDFGQAAYRECVDRIVRSKPEAVGFSVNSYTTGLREILSDIRGRIRPFFIAGGPAPTLYEEDFLSRYPDLDCITLGESEETLWEIFRVLEKSKDPMPDLLQVKGLILNHRGERIRTPVRSFGIDLNSMPFPDYAPETLSRLNYYPLLTSRGCDSHCVFCPNRALHGFTWRARSVENVVSEIEKVIRDHSLNRFFILDDSFNLDLERAKNILREVLKRKIRIQYSFCSGLQIRSIDAEFLDLLKKSGCAKIGFGIETADPESAGRLGKGLSLDMIKTRIDLTVKSGFRPEVYMIVGLIGATVSSERRSLSFIKGLNVLARWFIAQPYPKTPLYDWVARHGRFFDPPDLGEGVWNGRPPLFFETPEFTKEDMLRTYYHANSETDNYLFLCSGNNPLILFLTGLFRVIRYNPRRTLGFLVWAIKGVMNPTKYVYNEHWVKEEG